MKNKSDERLHWSEQKEAVSSNKPLIFAFKLIKILPDPLLHCAIHIVGFFYTLSSKRARKECIRFQKQLREFSKGKSPVRISSRRQILSFCFCIVEKMQGWLGKYKYDKINPQKDMNELLSDLDSGKGALLIGSHLGNIELLRGISSSGENGLGRKLSVTTIMEKKATANFNKTLLSINPEAGFQVIDPSEINPETVLFLQDQIEKGGIVVVAADRTSARTRNRVIRESFLGKAADFPYGVFLLAFLLKAPVYYFFGLREKNASLKARYSMFVEKSDVSLECSRNEREECIKELCREFREKLEFYAEKYPYQFYNFYNFWQLENPEL